MNNELYHHGIKGQRWGIRRYQNRDGSRTTLGKARRQSKERTIDAGYKFYRVVRDYGDGDEPLDSNRKYVSTTQEDHEKWEKYFKSQIPDAKWDTYMYTSVKDIKVAETEAGERIFNDLMNDRDFAKNVYAAVYQHGIKESDRQSYDDFYELYSAKFWNYDVPVNEIKPVTYGEFASSLGWQTDATKTFFNTLGAKGYDAVEDYFGKYGVGSYTRISDDPLILLNPKETIKRSK